MDERCACCGGPFHCGVADDQPCWCASVSLDAQQLHALQQRFVGCLCPRCLIAEAKTEPLPSAAPE